MESPLFAVASGTLIAIVGMVMAMHPEYRLLGWAVIAALTVMFCWSTARFLFDKYPNVFDLAGSRHVLIGVFALAGVLMSACAMLALDNPWSVQTNATYASVRIQFYGDDRLPTEIRNENVMDWYAYYSPSARSVYKDKATGKEETIALIPKSWAIFLVLKRPVDYREITIGFSAPGLPVYNVLQRSQNSIVIGFSGDIPAGELEISTKGNN
jgi:hypothetical protein